MRNNIYTFVILFITIFLNSSVLSSEQFNFNVTEIEINKKGTVFRGLKRGTITTQNGIVIEADEFEYNKTSNILSAAGNVETNDLLNDIKILSNDITYNKNNETIYTETKSKAVGKNIIIDANSFKYNKKLNILNAIGEVEIFENFRKINLNSDEVSYFIDKNKFFSKNNSSAKMIDDDISIIADNFEYDQLLNIINANGNVAIIDIKKNLKLFSENITYFKNKEKIFTQGRTNATIDKKYDFKSKDVTFFREKMILISSEKSVVEDDSDTIYTLDSFHYTLNKEILKGNNVKIITNFGKKKSDKFNFSSGIFYLNEKKFAGKDTKIFLHKNIFAKEKEKFLELIEKTEIDNLKVNKSKFENEPRLYGLSSSGNEDKTTVNKGIFTSCKKNADCPAWSMKSRKIIHDKKKRQLIYENSILNLYNIPVFYFPKFFHPDPTVKRQSGFLRPQLNRSKTLGTSFYLPYYHVISENKDFTFKPQIFDSEIEMFQNEYRQVNKNSSFIADFGITKGYQSSLFGSKRNSIGHFFGKFNIDLNFEDYITSKFNIFLESVTNDTFLKVFQNNFIKTSLKPKSNNSLSSGFEMILDHKNFNFDTGMKAYETLSGKESDRYQYNFPYYNFSNSFDNNLLNGSFSFSSSGENVLNNTNILKTSIDNSLTYNSTDYFSNLGIKNNFGIHFKNLNTVAKNHLTYKSNLQTQLMSIFEARSEFPLIKDTNNFSETITPTISFRINPGQMKSLKARSVNIDNIFSINRLGLSDAYEKGKSITMGINYKKSKNNDKNISYTNLEDIEKYFEVKLAGVLRDVEEDKISSSSTLNRRASNLFGSITNNMSDKIQLKYNFAIDNDLTTFEKNEVDLKFSINNLISTFTFSERNGEMGDSNSISNSTLFKFDDNNYFTFETRRNRKISLTEYYDLIYEYKNDCLTAGVKYRKTYYSDRDAKPTEDLLLTLTLFPLMTLEQNVDQNFYRENDLFN